MAKKLAETIASSSAHGISRAAASENKLLRVMWILLFLICLAVFLKSGINLVLKLQKSEMTKKYQLDQATFVLPDLYFCPINPYSGSYPFTLTKEEADLVNSRIKQLIDRFGELYDVPKSILFHAFLWTPQVQLSLPFDLLAKYLLVRKEESVQFAAITDDFVAHNVDVEAFYNYENLVCFRLILSDKLKKMIMNPGSTLKLRLSTDPYLAELNFTGHPIQPIADSNGNSVPFLEWHPYRYYEQLRTSGFTMLIVPPGAYPSLRFEESFHMSPGFEYSVQLKMTESTCSEELHDKFCLLETPPVEFMNSLSGKRERFNYSNAACYYRNVNVQVVDEIGCQLSQRPSLWEFRDYPHCSNMSEMTAATVKRMRKAGSGRRIELETLTQKYCKTRIPCSYPIYSTSYSFGKWPSAGSSILRYFAEYFNRTSVSKAEAPALARVSDIAKQLQMGDHSAHLEGIFHSYVSESMLSVQITIDSLLSPQVMLAWSYTFADLLADTGGLLGLYIGCSVLTVCEMFELIYICVSLLLKRRSAKRSSSRTGDQETAGCDVGEKQALGGENAEEIELRS
ncbi:hypothetical protein BOX15_Mlig026138g1 [Macrostomum lignano]|uniref:Uncharacterized protein n=1 Tax=Macrostomum lignano TaxID=282301 RepID=A0A267GWM4_9PLAT|nr:hypothetical protein BOX15_Mlig026138g1 [Macrostomum lignano]